MQGFNMGRYVPPDLEGTISGNKLNRRRAPGTLRQNGTQTVRFEMPFAVWCTTCVPDAIIGQGVRFNAVKEKVGEYYSTPIFSFRMRHPACSGTIEIRTDPKNTAYVVTAGGKARDYGDHDDRIKEGENGVPILTPEEREKRREDAFASLEGKVEEKRLTKDNSKRIQELYDARERDWNQPGMANKRLRDSFRQDRKRLEREKANDEALKDRLGTEIDILPEAEEDRARAKLVTFGERRPAPASNIFSPKPGSLAQNNKALTSKVKSDKTAKQSRAEVLRRQLLSSTRATLNPFGT